MRCRISLVRSNEDPDPTKWPLVITNYPDNPVPVQKSVRNLGFNYSWLHDNIIHLWWSRAPLVATASHSRYGLERNFQIGLVDVVLCQCQCIVAEAFWH